MIKYLVVLALLLALPLTVMAQTSTPTPGPTPTATPLVIIPGGEISGAAGGASSDLNSVGDSLTAPGGINLLPTVNWGLVFGYIKWLIAPPTGDELAGPFGPIMTALGALLTAEISFLGIKGIVYVASYVLSFVAWLFKLILAIITFIVNVVSAIPGILLGFVGL